MADLVSPRDHAPVVRAWDHALADPNLEDARIAHALDRLAEIPLINRLEAMYRGFRMKRWQYMTAVTDELFLAFVVGTAGFAGNGFVYAAELPGGAVHQRFAITPLARGVTMAPTSARGSHRFAGTDLAIQIDNTRDGRVFHAAITARTVAGAALRAELQFDGDRTVDDHLALCVPLPGQRWSYTHKFAAFGVTGEVTIDGRRIAFSSERSFGTLDFTKMYAQRHAVWRWITLCGRSTRGAVIGLNLVDPTPDATVSENALWVDGRREPLAGVRLVTAGEHWRVEADSIDLDLRAIAQVEQKLDVPLVRHRLRHVIGSFSGRVRTQGGQVHELESIAGIAEDNDTWW
jgi:hypothetical protein